MTNLRHTLGDGDAGKACAITEGIITNLRHTLGDSDAGKACATSEGPYSNLRHTLGDGDAGKAAAAIECTFTNTCHALGDGDAGKACAIPEGIITNLCCPFGNNGHAILNFIICHNSRLRFTCTPQGFCILYFNCLLCDCQHTNKRERYEKFTLFLTSVAYLRITTAKKVKIK